MNPLRFCLSFFVFRFVWPFCLAVSLSVVFPTLNAQSTAPSSQDSPTSEQGTTDGEQETRNTANADSNSVGSGQSIYGMKQLGKDLFRDQKAIWTSPFKVQPKDLKWIVPVFAASGGIIALDRRIADRMRDLNFKKTSRVLSNLGGPTNFATAGLLYGIGSLAKKERARETGLLGLRAVSAAWVTVQVLKQLSNRERPGNPKHGSLTHEDHGSFWTGGTAFPSGHAASTWAWATVIVKQYPEKPLLQTGAYAFATAVSLSRMTADRHFASDVLVGSIIGYLIGRYVIHDRRSRK